MDYSLSDFCRVRDDGMRKALSTGNVYERFRTAYQTRVRLDRMFRELPPGCCIHLHLTSLLDVMVKAMIELMTTSKGRDPLDILSAMQAGKEGGEV